MLTALRSFLTTPADGAIGGLGYYKKGEVKALADRRKLARKSLSWYCNACKVTMSEVFDDNDSDSDSEDDEDEVLPQAPSRAEEINSSNVVAAASEAHVDNAHEVNTNTAAAAGVAHGQQQEQPSAPEEGSPEVLRATVAVAEPVQRSRENGLTILTLALVFLILSIAIRKLFAQL